MTEVMSPGAGSGATGLGPLDLAILGACERLGAGPRGTPVTSTVVLDAVYATTGVGPRLAYEPLCHLARPWIVHLPLIDFTGNYGSPDFGPAAPEFTEVRLTLLGAAALAAERGETRPLPIGLINGDLHVGGRRPPLDPGRVIEALRAGAEHPPSDIAAIVGAPAFPSGCLVEVADAGALAQARPTELTVTARIGVEGPTRLVISAMPPDSSVHRIVQEIWALTQRPDHAVGPLEQHFDVLQAVIDVTDDSSEAGTRIEVELAAGTDLAAVADSLHTIWAVQHTITVWFAEPLGDLITRSVGHAANDLPARLDLLESVVRPPA